MRVKWTTALAAFLLLVTVITAMIAGVDHNPWAMAVAGVLAVVSVGVSVLSLHER